LLISGTFREIDEGERRRPNEVGSAVIADVQIKADCPAERSSRCRALRSSIHAPPRGVGASQRRDSPRNRGQRRWRRESGAAAKSRGGTVAEFARPNNWLQTKR